MLQSGPGAEAPLQCSPEKQPCPAGCSLLVQLLSLSPEQAAVTELVQAASAQVSDHRCFSLISLPCSRCWSGT